MPFKLQWTEEAILEAVRDWTETYGEPPAQPDWNPYQSRVVFRDEARALRYESHPRPLPSFSTTIRRFGSWSRAIEAAGFDARPSGGGGGNTRRRRDVGMTHCRHGHEYTPENTHIVSTTGARRCRKCQRAAVQKYQRGKKK